MPRSKSKQKLRRNRLRVARKQYQKRVNERKKTSRAQAVSVKVEPVHPPTKRTTTSRRPAARG